MKLIRTLKNDYDIVAEIRVTGLVLWRFRIAVSEFSRTRRGDDDDVRKIVLGTPDTIGGEASAWIFNVMNPGDRDTKFTTAIRWKQGERKIASWGRTGTVKAGKVSIRSGEARFVLPGGSGS